MAQLLSILALSTKAIMDRRISELIGLLYNFLWPTVIQKRSSRS